MQNVVIACDDLFGLEILSIIEEINKRNLKNKQEFCYNVVGFISDSDNPFEGIDPPVQIVERLSNWNPTDNTKVVMGIRDPNGKVKAVEMLRRKNALFETVVAPWMLSLREWLTIGEGCIVAPYSAKPGMVIGDFVTINASMLSGHRIGSYSTVMRFANIAGDGIGESSFVGNHVFLAVGKSIGDNCFVADGSIVVKDLKNGSSVAGIPAKKKK